MLVESNKRDRMLPGAMTELHVRSLSLIRSRKGRNRSFLRSRLVNRQEIPVVGRTSPEAEVHGGSGVCGMKGVDDHIQIESWAKVFQLQ